MTRVRDQHHKGAETILILERGRQESRFQVEARIRALGYIVLGRATSDDLRIFTVTFAQADLSGTLHPYHQVERLAYSEEDVTTWRPAIAARCRPAKGGSSATRSRPAGRPDDVASHAASLAGPRSR